MTKNFTRNAKQAIRQREGHSDGQTDMETIKRTSLWKIFLEGYPDTRCYVVFYQETIGTTIALKKIPQLTLCCMNSVLRLFLRYIPRQALIVYRLIDAALIRNFFLDPFLF